MAEEQFQERTEKATVRRRQKAKEEGKVARSNDLNSAVILCLGITAIYFMGPTLADQLHQFMTFMFSEAPNITINRDTIVAFFSQRVLSFFFILAPLLVILAIIAYSVNILQIGIIFTSKPLEPKLDKLNIVSGFKRLISVRSLVDLVRDCTKVLLVGVVGYLSISSQLDTFLTLSDKPVTVFAGMLGKMALRTSLHIGMVMLVLALIDYAYQKYEFEKSIRMSKQEIREENKDTEGSPETRARVRRIQHEMAQRRMMREIPKADVIVTNPTHIAVALKYDKLEMDAPMVVAKGERLIAEKIKEIAELSQIPIVENKPLARALFKICDIGSYVPSHLYRAVAEVLAYVYRLKGEKV